MAPILLVYYRTPLGIIGNKIVFPAAFGISRRLSSIRMVENWNNDRTHEHRWNYVQGNDAYLRFHALIDRV